MIDRVLKFSSTPIQQILGLAREHLDMEVAFIGEFVNGRRAFRYVSAASDLDVALHVGHDDPVNETFCHWIATGVLDEVIPDAASHPFACQIPATSALNVRAHIGTSIVLKDGQVYGTLCSFRRQPDPTLCSRDLKFLRLIAALIADRIHEQALTETQLATRRSRIQAALSAGDPDMVFQPIVTLETRSVAGYEALARFRTEPDRSPAIWFSEARDVGLHTDLELGALRAALAKTRHCRAPFVSVNVSPAVLCDREVLNVLDTSDCSRLVLEMTELDNSVEPVRLRAAIDDVRARGVRIALDDVGAGYAGLSRLLAIAPDIIKLDRDITQRVARDPVRQSMVTATVSFCNAVGAVLIAEGIESEDDLEVLQRLGVRFGQGYLLGHPGPARA